MTLPTTDRVDVDWLPDEDPKPTTSAADTAAYGAMAWRFDMRACHRTYPYFDLQQSGRL